MNLLLATDKINSLLASDSPLCVTMHEFQIQWIRINDDHFPTASKM